MGRHYTDDPVQDFLNHDAEQQQKMDKLPVCCECDHPIQTEEYFEINDEPVCPECLKENHRKLVEDYVS